MSHTLNKGILSVRNIIVDDYLDVTKPVQQRFYKLYTNNNQAVHILRSSSATAVRDLDLHAFE